MDINKFGVSLEEVVHRADEIQKVPKGSLEPGDYVFVKTVNSLYSICKREDNLFEVRGGWFDRKGLSPALIPIRGCTWGVVLSTLVLLRHVDYFLNSVII